jgi:hypothetical protein
LLGQLNFYLYISTVIREIDMKDVFWIDGLGWVREIIKNRLNEVGVPEPYTEYELVKK